VYSTEKGRICPRCGWPTAECRCSAALDQPVPARITARLRIERAGRKGKTVTVIESLPRNQAFLKQLCTQLKKACGTGGTVVEDRVELQGEQREKLRELLLARGWTVRG